MRKSILHNKPMRFAYPHSQVVRKRTLSGRARLLKMQQQRVCQEISAWCIGVWHMAISAGCCRTVLAGLSGPFARISSYTYIGRRCIGMRVYGPCGLSGASSLQTFTVTAHACILGHSFAHEAGHPLSIAAGYQSSQPGSKPRVYHIQASTIRT